MLAFWKSRKRAGGVRPDANAPRAMGRALFAGVRNESDSDRAGRVTRLTGEQICLHHVRISRSRLTRSWADKTPVTVASLRRFNAPSFQKANRRSRGGVRHQPRVTLRLKTHAIRISGPHAP